MINAILVVLSEDSSQYMGQFSFYDFSPDTIINAHELTHCELVEYTDNIITFVDTSEKMLMYINPIQIESGYTAHQYGINYE